MTSNPTSDHPSMASFGQPPASGSPSGATAPDDLSLPLPGATFPQAVKRWFQQYATFTGRASRSEYWWAALCAFVLWLIPVVLFVTGIVVGVTSAFAQRERAVFNSGSGSRSYYTQPGIVDVPGAMALMLAGALLLAVIWLATIVPTVSLTWRRLHDADLPGPLFFLSLIPSFGALALLVFGLLPSKPEGRRFDAVRRPAS